jgi:subtilisin family serine protease
VVGKVKLRRGRRWGLLVGTALVGVATLTAATTALGAGKQPTKNFRPAKKSSLVPQGTTSAAFTKDVGGTANLAPVKNGMTSVIVKLSVDAVADYRGGVAGYAPTAPSQGGTLDLKSANAQAYLAYVDSAEKNFADRVQALAPSSSLTYQYDVAMGGVAMIVPVSQIDAIQQMKGVEWVQRDTLQHIDTDHSPQFIGATTLWGQLGLPQQTPRNEVVAVIDTGIWPEHPSYSPNPNDGTGFPIPAPPPPRSGVRQCQFSGGANPGPAFVCNNKLIAAQRFMTTYTALVGLLPGEYTTARDDNGHGTHTSSTAAGDAGVQASIFGISRGTVSGIDPRAHVMAYKALGESGGFSSDLAAAAQKAITDGADVINYSISGGANPYTDTVEQVFLSAYNAGVLVSASAGNSGPGSDTTDHRAPWDITVGASTEDRSFNTQVALRGSNGDIQRFTGVSVSANSPIAPVVDAGAAPTNDPLCLNSTADGAFSGKIVICRRGTNGRAEKGKNVLTRGAVGMILVNTVTPSQDVETDNHWLPGIHLDTPAGTALLNFFNSHTGVIAQWNSGQPTPSQGDVMAAFSSRGGPGQTVGVSKPDVTAPGVQILAGNTPTPVDVASGPPGQLFQAIAGTSMSSPHVAGAAALLKALHPGWTPGQIHSALMTTGNLNVFKEDGSTLATPYDDGSGRIDLTRAGSPGITFDETGANWASFSGNPGNAFTGNYPSVYIPNMPGLVTVQRTAHSVLGSNSSWAVTAVAQKGLVISVPGGISIPAGGDTTFNITVDASALPLGATRYGYVRLNDNNGHNAVLPVTVVRGQGPVTLAKNCTPASVALNGTTHCTITAGNTQFTSANITIDDTLPNNLSILPASITGASQNGNGIHFSGSLAGATPPQVTAATCGICSPAGGYLPLSLFGTPPIAAPDDDTVTNFNTDPFSFEGQTWTRIGVSSNGYLIVGGGSGSADNQFAAQSFPDPTRPNNVLAAFWTDLNPQNAGTGHGDIRVDELTDGSNDWIVVDWNAVDEFGGGFKHTGEIWIGTNNDASPVEDITFTYGPNSGTGSSGMTVGAENLFGNSGNNVYRNGVGVYPSSAQDVRVTSTAGTASTKVITFDAVGVLVGSWRNCATMTSSSFIGTSYACIDGDVH